MVSSSGVGFRIKSNGSDENGYRIGVGITDVETIGIDTPQDLARAEEFLSHHPEFIK